MNEHPYEDELETAEEEQSSEDEMGPMAEEEDDELEVNIYQYL